LGVALFEKKDLDAARAQFDAVGNNDKSPHRAHGLYRSAECLLAQGKPDEARRSWSSSATTRHFITSPG
jgi:TolA-binding protein